MNLIKFADGSFELYNDAVFAQSWVKEKKIIGFINFDYSAFFEKNKEKIFNLMMSDILQVGNNRICMYRSNEAKNKYPELRKYIMGERKVKKALIKLKEYRP